MATSTTSPQRSRPPRLRRMLTTPGGGGAAVVIWGSRPVSTVDAESDGASGRELVEAPLRWSNLAVETVARRYFAGGPEDRRERSVRVLAERVTGAIAGWALDYGQVADEDERDTLRDELEALVLTQCATFATPVWLNAGLEERPLTSACFILGVEDSIPGLLDWNTHEALIFQHGGGAGTNLSSIRSSHEPLSGGGLASGPVSFMRATDAWAASVGAGGRARRGAKMVVLDASHPDIFELIEAKAHEEDHGRALLAAGYPLDEVLSSLAFQHANHAVRVSDEFMRLALGGGSWELRAVTSGEVLATLPARRLLRACAEAAVECGDPGLQFQDQIAGWHTTPNAGPITASNPCGEFLCVTDSACNIATLNLLAFLRERRFDIERFTGAVELLVSAQDAIVDGSGYPSPQIAGTAARLRPIGLGYANLGALLLALAIPYDSSPGRDLAAAVTALMTAVAYRRSAELAAALGPFPGFAANRGPMLGVIARHIAALGDLGSAGSPGGTAGADPGAEIAAAARREWERALVLGRRHGYRNAQVTLVAPTGTVSFMLDCETTGIEPYHALTTVRRFADGRAVRLSSRLVADALAALGHADATIERLAEYALDHGHLDDASDLSPAERAVFRTATGPSALSPLAHLRMVAAVQPFVSGGVSKTVPLPPGAGPLDAERAFVDAWRLGLKAVAVYREGSKLAQPLSTDGD